MSEITTKLEGEQQNNEAPSTQCARELLRFLAERGAALSNMLILTHDYPDPDALATAFALQHLLQQGFGVESKIAYGGVIGRMENRAMVNALRIPARRLKRTDFKTGRAVALVDTQPAFKNNSFPQNRRVTLVIDQHVSEKTPAADLALIDTGCGATCVIVAQAMMLMKMEIPVRVATALAYGILSDTLDLYRATRADVVQTYLSVLHHCDMRALARIQNPDRSKNFFVTLGRCIRESLVYRHLIVAHLGNIANPDLVSQMAEFLLTYDRIKWAFCTGRYKGRLHASLRTSVQDTHAGEILRDIFENRKEAGGHKAIAGGSFKVGLSATEEIWKEREQALHLRLRQRLRISKRTEYRKPFQR
ncbi:MAG: DHH family phosphoesterase [Verrucomicrobia bacterium]|nr:DHH family phosphoesterase [Verrucomicrobiota bacterium]